MAASRPTLLYGEREALSFLEQTFGGKPDDCYIVLWELAGRQSTSFLDLAKAAAWANGRDNAYIHVGLVRRSFQGGHRPKATEIDGIVGFWADLDVADPVHKKQGLPPNEVSARFVAGRTGLKPSIIVHSGHGIQAWWLLSEPWIFESSEERARAAKTARAWDLSLRERARREGYTLDAVGDLSRLLRVPGTRNTKALPLPVRIESSHPERYSLDDIEAALLDDAWQQAERELRLERGTDRAADDGDLVLNPAAEPPFERMYALMENEPRFMATWSRSRRDVKGWSASEYDMALARFAALANWSRQEITNMLISCRRKHGDDLKLRQDYYATTIAKAQADEAEREVIHEAVALAEEARKQAPGDPEVNRGELLARVCEAIKVPIARLVRTTSEPPTFRIETVYGSGVLGGIGAILENRKFREKVAELTNRAPRRFKSEIWDPLAQALLQAAEEEAPTVDTTVVGRAETWLSLYLGERRPAAVDQLDERTRGTMAQRMPPHIGDDGRIRIFATGFRQWLIEVHHEMLTANEVGSLLRAYGCEPETRHFKTETGRTSRSIWALPRRDDGRGG